LGILVLLTVVLAVARLLLFLLECLVAFLDPRYPTWGRRWGSVDKSLFPRPDWPAMALIPTDSILRAAQRGGGLSPLELEQLIRYFESYSSHRLSPLELQQLRRDLESYLQERRKSDQLCIHIVGREIKDKRRLLARRMWDDLCIHVVGDSLGRAVSSPWASCVFVLLTVTVLFYLWLQCLNPRDPTWEAAVKWFSQILTISQLESYSRERATDVFALIIRGIAPSIFILLLTRRRQ
jgi:hypothetical protein